jgi:hypothetical protein
MPILRIVLFGLGAALIYAGGSLINEIYSAGYAVTAMFAFTSYRYGIGRQPTEICLAIMVIAGLALVGWSVRRR